MITMKKMIAYLIAVALLLSGMQGMVPFAFAAGDDTESFSSSFEKIDPVLNITPLEGESTGVSAIETKTVSLAGEFTNYAPTYPVVVNRTLTYGSPGETEATLIDDDLSTKLCATKGVTFPLEFTFTFSNAITPHAYYISGAGDDMQYSDRVLSEWKLFASNTNSESDWVELDSRSGVQWASNNEIKNFAFNNTTAYKYFKLSVTKRGNTPTSSSGVLQFTGFALGDRIEEKGSGGEVDHLYTVVTSGPQYNWGGRAGAWSGKSSLRVSGKKISENAKSYTVLYDNLNIEVFDNTKLSYMVFPDIGTNYDLRANDPKYNYDFEYTSMYAAIDLEFSDGTRLKDYEALDQYQNVVSPHAQGASKVMVTNNWLNITTKLSTDSRLVGKHINKILVGFEKNDGSSNKDVSTFFDDVKIFRQDDPVITNLADYVNILRGTYTKGNNPARGINAAHVATPNPFNYWSPATENGRTPYFYNGAEANFKNIKISHVASNWIAESGIYHFSADSTTQYTDAAALGTALKNRGSTFKHENEVAKPYYYGVTFNANDKTAPGVKIEVTPTEHAAILRFTFPQGAAKRNIILDPVSDRSTSTIQYTPGEKTYFATSATRSNGQETMDIYGEFSVAPTSWRLANDGSLGMFEFPAAENGDTVIEMKVATSFMTPAQAKKNLDLEIDSTDNFDSIKARALKIWNDTLSVIKVEGGTHDQLVTLYSNLYRASIYPTSLAENTGTAESPKWQYTSPYPTNKNSDQNVVKDGTLLYNNGFWDTYRTAWPLYSILTPKKSTSLLNGLVQHYIDQGWVPRWIAPGGTNSMVGTNSDNIFADALSRGIDFDVEHAYLSALRNGSVYSVNSTANSYSGRSGMDRSAFIGYYPNGNTSDDNLSWSLEGYATDFGIATMAKILRDKETEGTEIWRKYNDEYLYFTARSKNYVNMFNPNGEGWFRAKKADGTWLQADKDFNPVAMGYGYCEDNAYGYAFHTPHDGQGLANLYGKARGKDGRAALGDKLDEAFSALGTADPGAWSGHKENWEGRECKQGQVHMDNQPAHHIPYMYLFTDRPWKTAETVRDTLDRLFIGENVGQGYIGDDDNGEASSWYILSALGLSPLTNGNGVTAIGTPLFQKATITRDDGKTIVINAPGVSREKKYVQSVKVNGQAHTSTVLAPELFQNDLTIDFTMGNQPSNTWGVDAADMPPSLTSGTGRPEILKDLTGAITPSITDLPTGGQDGAYTNGERPAAMFNNLSVTSNPADEYTYWATDTANFVTYYFNKPVTVKMYTITSWNAENAPTDWIFSGSNDGEEWQPLDIRTGQSFNWPINPTAGGDKYTRPFAIDSAKQGSYRYYKLELTNWTHEIRVSELELLGDEFATMDKAALQDVIDRAKGLEETKYGPESWQALLAAIVHAEAVYLNQAATPEQIATEISDLEQVIKDMVTIKQAWTRFEAVNCDEASSGIKKESTENATGAVSGTVTNLGGLKDGMSIGFKYVDFGNERGCYTDAKLIYAGKNADLKNSRATFHLDDPDTPAIANFDNISGTGSNWNVFVELSAALTRLDISGMHKLYVKFYAQGASVMNLHSIIFDCDTTKRIVTSNLTNLTGNAPVMATIDEPLSFTLMAAGGYHLPDTITVTMGGNPLAAESDYIYNSATGTVSIPSVTGTIVVTAAGVKELISIDGTVAIDGVAKYGETLTANVDGVTPSEAQPCLTYQWYRGDAPIDGATYKTYTLAEADIDADIKVTVTAHDDYTGERTSAAKAVTKAVGPNLSEGVVGVTHESAENANDGTITGVNTTMEYRLEGNGIWRTCGDGSVENLAPGKYQVRYAATETHEAGSFVTVEIRTFNAPTPAPTPAAVFDAATMTLANVTTAMEYKVNDGPWNPITGTEVDLSETGLTGGSTIRVYQPGNGSTSSDSAEQLIPLTQASAPTGLDKTDVTKAGNDGKITGVTTAMEYKAINGLWTDITGEAITDLVPGDYLVRVKGAGTVLASPGVKLTIAVYIPPEKVDVTGVILDKGSITLYTNRTPGSSQLTATVAPEDATDKSVTWSSDNEAVATVDENGLVTAVAKGSATITVTTADGNFTATCTIMVSTDADDSGDTQTPTPPSTTTETRQNPDGSTTKIVTDKKTGTVAETTTWPDGTKIVTTTAKGGAGISEVTLPKGKNSATVTIPTKNKPAPGEVAVVVNPDGTREIIKNSVATGSGIRVTLTEGAKLEIMDNSKHFIDVSNRDWFNDSVQFVASRELFSGTAEDTFSPGIPMSRAMLMTVLARLDGQDTTKGETWDSVGMAWARETGISDGANPEAGITREQLVTMLYRYAKAEQTQGDLSTFPDADDVSSWAAEAMAWAVEQDLIKGDNGRLNPARTATRAEVAAVLQRLTEKLNQ